MQKSSETEMESREKTADYPELAFKRDIIAASRLQEADPTVKKFLFSLKQPDLDKLDYILNHVTLTPKDLFLSNNGTFVVSTLQEIMQMNKSLDQAIAARKVLKPLVMEEKIDLPSENPVAAPAAEQKQPDNKISEYIIKATEEFKQELATELKDEDCDPILKKYLSSLPEEDLGKIEHVLNIIGKSARILALADNGAKTVTTLKEMMKIDNQQDMNNFAKRVLNPLIWS